MKTKLLLAAVSTFFILHSAFGQGALTPPGVPAPTMKTLAQIEPRTPIATNTTPGDASDTYIISQAGSYYLTANIVGVSSNTAIEILANNVTLDLNGFTIQGVSTSTAAVFKNGAFFEYNTGIEILNAQTNITVRNGNIVSWAEGIFGGTPASANLTFENLHFANCYLPSSTFSGMDITGAATVRHCSFEHCNYGLALNNNNTASPSVVTDCTANDNSYGIFCGGSGIISSCTACNNSSTGIRVDGNGGIEVSFTVSGCTANNNLVGIYIVGARNRIENNQIFVGTGTYGINVAGLAGNTNNVIVKNSVSGGGANNYSIGVAGNDVGPIGTAATSTSPWANISH